MTTISLSNLLRAFNKPVAPASVDIGTEE